jgi:hypothetical protein
VNIVHMFYIRIDYCGGQVQHVGGLLED